MQLASITTKVVKLIPDTCRGVLSTALCDKVYQVRYSPGTPVSSYTNKIDLHNIAEILLKVMLETINPTYIYC